MWPTSHALAVARDHVRVAGQPDAQQHPRSNTTIRKGVTKLASLVAAPCIERPGLCQEHSVLCTASNVGYAQPFVQLHLHSIVQGSTLNILSSKQKAK